MKLNTSIATVTIEKNPLIFLLLTFLLAIEAIAANISLTDALPVTSTPNCFLGAYRNISDKTMKDIVELKVSSQILDNSKRSRSSISSIAFFDSIYRP
ncbi:MAG: hypothetical protein N3E44_05440 [Candidatus Bathyarchaeota archaeon]|nr:hypothetical protein [Candidatus Bathyarchaeota archaeon]